MKPEVAARVRLTMDNWKRSLTDGDQLPVLLIAMPEDNSAHDFLYFAPTVDPGTLPNYLRETAARLEAVLFAKGFMAVEGGDQ